MYNITLSIPKLASQGFLFKVLPNVITTLLSFSGTITLKLLIF
jgi:hypothetical protein